MRTSLDQRFDRYSQLFPSIRAPTRNKQVVGAVGGTHLSRDALTENARLVKRLGLTGFTRNRHDPNDPKRVEYRQSLRLTHRGPSHNPEEERRALMRRLINMESHAGREANAVALSDYVAPDFDMVGNKYRIATLVQTQADLPHAPYHWPVWKVRARSGL